MSGKIPKGFYASVSNLCAYQRFLDELMSEEDLAKQIMTPFSEVSEVLAVQRGNDLHRFLATGDVSGMVLSWDFGSVRGHVSPDDLTGMKDVWISDFTGEKYGIPITARADLIHGGMVTDFKVTGSGFDFEALSASWQWRFYLDLAEADTFRYRVFEVSDSLPIKIFRNHSCVMNAYPRMHDDCLAMAQEFCAWASRHPEVIQAKTMDTARNSDKI
jgi:hypothetical protein